MTAQILMKDTMQKTSTDPGFMIRWLNGTLSEEELSTLRNREEYEEMVSSNKVESVLTSEKRLSKEHDNAKKDHFTKATNSNKSSSFSTFAFVTIALLTVVMMFVKLNGWW